MPLEKDQLRARIRDLELTLGQGNDTLAATFRLTPVLNNLLGLLLTLPVVTPEMIRQRLEIAPDAKVAIHRLRRHLDPWKIAVGSKRNVGYWLDADAKTAIKALMGGALITAQLDLATDDTVVTLEGSDENKDTDDDLTEAA